MEPFNTHNFAQKTTWILGSNKLNLFPLYLQDFSIPGINFNHPKVNSRPSIAVNFVADSITFNDLSCTILIDEHYRNYFEIMKKVFDQNDVEKGTFTNQEFDLFVLLQDQKGHDVCKIDFYNARISSIGDIQLATNDDSTENTLQVDFVYDYYLIDNLQKLATTGLTVSE